MLVGANKSYEVWALLVALSDDDDSAQLIKQESEDESKDLKLVTRGMFR